MDKGFLLDVEMGRGGGAQINSCVNISVGIRGGVGGGASMPVPTQVIWNQIILLKWGEWKQWEIKI